jgi:tRNA dimethylallyltransferase
MNNKFIIISGPTASGKSDLALKIADNFANNFQTVIINADALQIYQSLEILSCQPSALDQEKIEHNLYSILNPGESSSVGLWLKLLLKSVENAWARNKLPLIVGGSGMYISRLVNGIAEIPEISTEIKDEARNLYDTISNAEFKKLLLAMGQEESKILSLDKQRLIRSYEVLKQTSKTIAWWQKQPQKFLFPKTKFLHFNLDPSRDLLYNNCNQRFNLIVKSGALQEVENLMKLELNQYSSITKTIGYQEIKDFLLAKINFEEMILSATQKTRNYAKRQVTWFNNQFQEKITIKDYQQQLPEINQLIKNL